MHKNVSKLLAVGASFSLLFAACGGDDDDDASTAPASDPNDASTAPASDPNDASTAPASDPDDASTAPTSDPDDADVGTEEELDDLVAAAEEEGSVVFYCAPTENVCQALADGFGSKYDIDANFTRLQIADLSSRYMAEESSGASAADALVISNSTFLDDAFAEGYVLPLDENIPGGIPEAYPPEFRIDERGLVINMLLPQVVGYNTDLVSPEEVPKSYEDLLDPRWKDQIITANLDASEYYIAFWSLIADEFGTEFLEQMAAQDLRQIGNSAAIDAQALGAGEAQVAVPTASIAIDAVADAGAPVDYVTLAPTTGQEIGPALSAGAPHPNAARLFVHFLLSEDGVKVLEQFRGIISPTDTDGLQAVGFERAKPGFLERREEIRELLGL